MDQPITLIRRSYPGRPEYGTAVSRAILMRVAKGELGPTMRIHRPGREVAFGRQDMAAAGYERARQAAVDNGFAAVERLAGGRAAVFHEGTVAVTRAYPDPEPPRRTYDRFREVAGLVKDALGRIGVVDPRVGEVPGEYCPGAYSVNARGQRKLAGIGQRMITGGAHVGGVVVANGHEAIKGVLVPVYDALGLEWAPETTGSAAGELGREVDPEELADALVAEASAAHEVVEGDVDEETAALAERLLAKADGRMN